VFRFALYLSGNRAQAEDITSETFVRVWTSSARIDMATVKGYLFTIARHLYLQGLRQTGRNVALDDHLVDSGASAYMRTAAKEEFARVRAGLMQLPEVDRAVLLMRAFDEMSYDEIARAVGISLTAVKVKIHRARLRLGRLRGGTEPWK